MATYSEQYRQQHPLPSAPHQAQYQQDQHYQDQHQDQDRYQDQYQSQQSQSQSQYQQPQQFQQPQRQQQQSYPPTTQQQRPPQRPHHSSNKSRTFSFHSQKSHKSSGSKDLVETSAEKDAKRLHSKADPSLAINEAEPSVVAIMTEVSLSPLRSIQHKDNLGNAIADPDKSNPTRNRWERPLDTIRSFEAAIDGGYSRKSMIRGDTDSVITFNRRNTFQPGSSQPRFPQDSYYNNRPVSLRPDNRQSELGPPRQSYFDGQAYSNGYGAGPSRMRTSRLQNDQYMPQGRDQNIYPLPHKDRSYETVTSAAGSGHSDQNGYQTDPTSSDNSSIDRTSPAKRNEPVNDYGIGFNPTQSYQPQIPRDGSGRKPLPQNTQQPSAYPPQQPGPQVPQKQRTIIRRQPSQQSTAQSTLQRPEAPEKRKSWLSRRFSKRS